MQQGAVSADFARTLERELTAAKAEIAYVREESATHEHFKGEAYKIADTWKARAERAEADLALAKDDATHQVSVIAKLDADNAQLSGVVYSTRQASIEAMAEIRAAAGAPVASEDKSELRAVDYVSQLRARVAELEQDKDALLLLLRSQIRFNNERNAYEWVIYGQPGDMNQSVEAAIAAARAGKGAT